jgi:hypothetical protein
MQQILKIITIQTRWNCIRRNNYYFRAYPETPRRAKRWDVSAKIAKA